MRILWLLAQEKYMEEYWAYAWPVEKYMEEYALDWVGAGSLVSRIQATATDLPYKTQHLALLHLCSTLNTGELNELTKICS